MPITKEHLSKIRTRGKPVDIKTCLREWNEYIKALKEASTAPPPIEGRRGIKPKKIVGEPISDPLDVGKP